jgi:chromosome segregation ATPase
MATEQSKRTISSLNDKISENNLAIDSLTPLISPVEDKIDDFLPSIKAFDNQIIAITAQIQAKQAQIVSIGATAQSVVGCGTTTTTTVVGDLLQANTWNINTSSYNGDQPYGNITATTLTTNNSGIGSFNVYTNNGGASLGTYYSLTGPGYLTGTNGITTVTPTASDNATCTACKNAIATLESEITTLRSQASALITTANTLKGERTEVEVRRYGLRKGIEQLQADTTRISSVLTILTDPSNDAII